MEIQKPSKLKSAINFGTILGFALMILTLITYIFEMYVYKWFDSLTWIVLILGIYLGIKKYRDEVLDGFISYGQALGYGVLLTFFASIIVSFINYLYLGYVDVDNSFINYNLEVAEMGLYEKGLPDDQIEQAMEMTSMFMKPGILAISGVLGITFMGFIISLIHSAILKKDPENFEDVN